MLRDKGCMSSSGGTTEGSIQLLVIGVGVADPSQAQDDTHARTPGRHLQTVAFQPGFEHDQDPDSGPGHRWVTIEETGPQTPHDVRLQDPPASQSIESQPCSAEL